MAMEFDKLLVTGVERGASDLHLKANSPVVLRIHGRLVPQGDLGVITNEDMDAIARRCLTERMYTQLKDGREVDSAYSVPNFGRFRVNMFLALGVSIEDLGRNAVARLRHLEAEDGIAAEGNVLQAAVERGVQQRTRVADADPLPDAEGAADPAEKPN